MAGLSSLVYFTDYCTFSDGSYSNIAESKRSVERTGFRSQESKPIDPSWMMSAENIWIIISLCFFQLPCPVFGGYEHVCTYETYQRGVHPQGACGENLPAMLQLICIDKTKRSGRSRQDKIIDLWKLNATFPAEETLKRSVFQKKASPWKSMIKRMLATKEKALAFLSGNLNFSRSKKKSYSPGERYGDMNIVCECCYHQCAFAEFEDYCA